MKIDDKVYKKEEVEEILNNLRIVFPIVRLLREKEVCGRKSIEGVDKPCKCYEFWGKNKACENCISLLTLLDKKTNTKIEILDGKYYQVYSTYINIEGENCVIEMIKDLDDSAFVDPDSYNHFLKNYSSVNNKIYKDPLTNAYNRLYFEEKKNNKYLSAGVAMIDVDDFKTLNDEYGSRFGDQILQGIVDIILKAIRVNDSIIRIGPDEFLLVLPGVTASVFQNKLEAMRSAINEISINDHPNVKINISVGAVLSDNETLSSACEKADIYLHRAKAKKNAIITEWAEDSANNEVVTSDKPVILIVDDADLNRLILRSFLENDYEIFEARNGEECITLIEKLRHRISLVMLDLIMPGLTGFDLLSIFKNKDYMNNVPVIMISSEDDDNKIVKAYELGVTDYIRRPFIAKVVKQRVNNTVKLYLRQKKFELKVREQMEENDKISNMMSYILSFVVGYRNNESGPHVMHVEQISEIMIDEINMTTTKYYVSPSEKKIIVTAAGMHDIGKIGIDEKILNKPGKLTNEEYEEMKRHTIIGANIMSSMTMYTTEPFVNMVYTICRWHHERWDGKGYPDGLKGDNIPIAAQIVSLADVYDALVSPRVYKPGFSHEKAVEMILNNECGSFNPILLKCLMGAKDRIKRLYINDNSEVESTDTRN